MNEGLRSSGANDSFIGRRTLGVENHFNPCKGVHVGKRHTWFRRNVKSFAFMVVLMIFVFLLDSLMVSVFSSIKFHRISNERNSNGGEGDSVAYVHEERSTVEMYSRLLNSASSALTKEEFKQDSLKFWEEPSREASKWKPCADKRYPTSLGKPEESNGYIMVSANGGLNQQRVAICNAVALASLLNATLVLPKFLYSNVWKDPSQFGDIYQEDYFMSMLKDDIHIVRELPPHLKSLDVEAIGSLITDADIPKEAKPNDYVGTVLPLLMKNKVVHFLGFGNRLGFDPLPSDLQRLRCKFGSTTARRFRSREFLRRDYVARGSSKYLALHLRFEEDMVAYSLCDFGGGEYEKKELETYREMHFPLLIERLKNSKPVSPAELRKLGRCPLTPEEAVLVLAALGFKHGTYIYLAGSRIYGGSYRMRPFTSLYPNLVTKETLLTPIELAPFQNFSSQLAALDFIACATSDVFAMTDSGSQLSSLVSGFRTYYGDGHAPTLRPNKRRLAAIFSENSSIGWNTLEDRIRKMIEEGQRVRVRGSGRSIYRQPRCPECMCRS
ncbi:O-fucosyltransferase family protein isoform 2 [Hibiscus syriacus]|uniref:O-fucosyltransferase family protein n=1 Tax=Hibiscus syriacus TaxID=106335 RepID=A0A6A3C2A9_HIBSY|nr:O-fucosyltransferase family protein isoform 2 [Hibiscus syriacus]